MSHFPSTVSRREKPLLVADGSFTLTGIAATSSLGGPFGGGALSVRLTCQANPRPDTDQFAVATQTTIVSGVVNARTLRLRTLFAPAASTAPDLPGAPAVLRLRMNGALLVSVYLPGGLPARNRKLFVGGSADGHATLAVRSLRRNGTTVFLLGARVDGPALVPLAGKHAAGELVYTAGGLFSRASASFRITRGGTRASFP